MNRRLFDHVATWLITAVMFLAIVPPISILGYTTLKGFGAFNASFFTQLPAPVGTPGGGIANAFVGTVILVAIALIVGVPIGILAGVYVSEIAPRSRFAALVTFVSDVLSGVPTIVIGVFVYSLLVVPERSFSALSGGVALAIILLPTLVRTTDATLKLIPQELREAALSLGVPEWRVTLNLTLRAAAPGVTTGVLLGLARIAGETAPLLFTAFGNPYWSLSPFKPIASLPLIIFEYAISPYASWLSQAWGAALVLIAFVVGISLVVRYFTSRRRLT